MSPDSQITHVIATAGHVDHGKSTLVRALTGMEPDRWAEERRRGLTIDLGYAWTPTASGAMLAFVDVPGHQRFIGNMLAGLGPAPAVLFVVAADEGWSRQSEEHLSAVHALRLRHGVLAVTRSDLAGPGPALADAAARLAGSSLGVVPAVAVSGTTGAGLDELRDALDVLVRTLPTPDTTGRIRLWVDRSFSVRGSGTVVTGTLGRGCVELGDELELRGERVTVRGIQSLGATRTAVPAVARVALNLRGVPADAVRRGDVLISPGAWPLTTVFDARIDRGHIEGELPAEVVLHVGTSAQPARVRLLGDTDGQLARITVRDPLPLQVGDRGILRDPGRQTIAAGLLVLDPDPPPLRRRGAARTRAGQLAADDGTSNPEREVARREAVRRAHLAALGVPVLGVPRGAVERGGWLLSESRWQRSVEQARDTVAAWSRTHPLEPGMPEEALRRELEVPDRELLTFIVEAAGLVTGEGRVAGAAAATSLGAVEPSVQTVEARLAAEPFAAPARDELAALRLGRRELAAAERAGRLLRITDDVVLLPDAPVRAAERLAAIDQPFTISAARTALGTSRRVAVPLLEYLDERGLTERDGDLRRVRG